MKASTFWFLIGPLSVAAFSASVLIASAQTSNPSTDSGGELQQMTVTGYIVPRIGTGPQPVTTLDQQYIQDRAAQTVQDLILQLPQNLNSFNPGLNAGETFSPGATDVNLRGLGVSSTLVLVDGRRMAAFPFPQDATESFVDINSIPLAAVDRIEVLKDGGSATYGSDAIAGVVNIVLKDEYQGADLDFHYGISQRGDFEVYHASAVTGIVQQLSEHSKFSLLGVFDYYEQGPIDVRDRSWAFQLDHSRKGPYFNWQSPTYTNGLFADNSGNLYLVNPGTKGPSISQNDFTLGTTGVNSNNVVWNYQLEPREQRFGTYLKAKYQPTDWLQFYQQFSYQRNKDQGQIGTISPSGSDNITVPANNPYNPFGVSLSPQNTWFTEFGPAKTYTTVDTLRTVTGATLFLPNNWTVDASFLYAESDGDMHSINAIQKDKLQEALNGTLPGYQGQFYNPFVDFAVVNSPNGNLVNAIRTTTDTYSRTSLAIWSLKAGGDVIELPNGTVKAGFGLEYRSDKFNNYFDTNSKEGNIIGSGAQPSTTSASRYVRSAYFEFSFPILGNKWSFPGARSLEFDVQERFDDYSDFGEAAKPKFLVLYKPFDDLTLRATYSEGYRAPSLTELYSGTVYEQAGGLIDPQHPELGAQTYNIHVSGNPHLKAETAYSYYAGAVWSPGSVDPQHSWWGWANGFTAYVDWFQVVQRSQILQLTPSDALQNESQFPGAVVRFPSGFINYINSSYVNEGAVLVDGIDFGGSYNTKEFSWGKLELAADASYQYNHSVKDTNTSPVFLEDDSFHYPDFQLNASVFYSKTLFELDTLRTGFVINYTDSLHDTFDNFKGTNPSANVEPNGLVHRVGSYTTVNWQISYTVGPAPKVTTETPRVGYGPDGNQLSGESGISPKSEVSRNPLRTWFGNTTLTFGINNVFDARPPFADELFAFDPYASESPIGRYFYVELRKKF